MSLCTFLVICSTSRRSPSTTMVMREIQGSSVAPTAMLSMLYPRRVKSAATRERTPRLVLHENGEGVLHVPNRPFLPIMSATDLPRRNHREDVVLFVDSDVEEDRAVDAQPPSREPGELVGLGDAEAGTP